MLHMDIYVCKYVFIWFQYVSIYQFFYLSNKTTSFCLQLHADMVQLTSQIKKFMEITEWAFNIYMADTGV